MNLYKFLIIVSVMCCCMTGHSQKGWEVGGWLGASVYFGDLNTNYYLKKPGPAGGLNVRYNYNNRIATKGSINYFHIRADDADSRNYYEEMRNLNFNTNIIEINGQMEFNFLPYTHGSSDEFFTPYLALGASLFYFDPRTSLIVNDEEMTFSLREHGTEGQLVGEEYFELSGALCISGGFKWDINADWSFNIEIGSRLVFTDYLDDVSGQFPDFNALGQLRTPIAVDLSNRALVDGIAQEGRQRGNSRDNDTYNFVGIGIMKYFGRLECPKISNW